MRVGGVNHGHPKLVLVQQNISPSSQGSDTIIDLSTIPSTDEDMEVYVAELMLDLPTASVPITASKYIDALSLSQLIGKIDLRLSPESPPAKHGNNGDVLIQNMDGPRGLQLIELLSGKRIFRGAQARFYKMATPTASDTTDISADTITMQANEPGWLWNQLPMGKAGGAGATWSNRQRMWLPIGYRKGEPQASCAIPARWLNGDSPMGRKKAGVLTITLGSKMDGATITFAAEKIDLYAVVYLLPRDRPLCPLVPHIRAQDIQSTVLHTRGGIPRYVGLMKTLDANGNMQTHGYTDVSVRDGQTEVNDRILSRHIDLLASCIEEIDYRPCNVESSLGAATMATRNSRWGVPLIAHDPKSQVTVGIGTADHPMRIEINGTTETGTHSLVEASLTPNSPPVREEAKRWSPVAGAVPFPVTRNGNVVLPASGIPHLINARLAVPNPAALRQVSNAGHTLGSK